MNIHGCIYDAKNNSIDNSLQINKIIVIIMINIDNIILLSSLL